MWTVSILSLGFVVLLKSVHIGIILKNQKMFYEKIIIFHTQFSDMTNVMK